MRFSTLTLEELVRLVQIVGGEEVVQTMIAHSELPAVRPPKYALATLGQIESVFNRLGDQGMILEVASGQLFVELKRKVFRVLFDHTGRGIPFPGTKGTKDASRLCRFQSKHRLNYSEGEYGALYRRTVQCFGHGKFMPAKEFYERCEAVVARVKDDPQLMNLASEEVPYFPFMMPGREYDHLLPYLEQVIVPALARSLKMEFPERSFNNHLGSCDLRGQLEVAHDTRQELVFNALKQGLPVCGVYFPALQGFGASVAREFICNPNVPKHLILSGMEVLAAVVSHPHVMGFDDQTPGLDLASLKLKREDTSEGVLCFRAHGTYADFRDRDVDSHSEFAAGITILG